MNKIFYEDGKEVILNERELHSAKRAEQEIQNALGFEVPITTLTAIQKRVVEQKFFTVQPSLYLPIAVGNGAFSSNILTYRDYSIAGDFETGVINQGSSSSRLADADAAIDSITVPIINWAKKIGWNIFELKQAATSGNWDLVSAKEKSRKKNWDLGIQQIAFLGMVSNPNVLGLLTQPTVNSNTTLITLFISAMSDAQFQTLVAGLLAAYRANCAYTAMPTHFIIPELDYDGLMTPANTNFAITSKLEYLEKALKAATGNPNFKILPLSYAGRALPQNVATINKNRYVLLNYDEDSLRMDIPVDYTSTVQNTVDGFNFQNTAYAQYTGAQAYRPLETLYFDF